MGEARPTGPGGVLNQKAAPTRNSLLQNLALGVKTC